VLFSADSLSGFAALLPDKESIFDINVMLGSYGGLDADEPFNAVDDQVYQLIDEKLQAEQIAGIEQVRQQQNNSATVDQHIVISESNDVESEGIVDPLSAVPTSSVSHVVFIDAALPELNVLTDSFSNTDTAVVLIETTDDALLEITRTLSEHENLDSVQILSHGEDGVLHLGRSAIDKQALLGNQVAVGRWGDALNDVADIKIYGCDVAATHEGEQFLTVLSDLTGADVAGSDDTTGHQNQGGDWDLEFIIGQVDSFSPAIPGVQQDWIYSLASIDVDILTDEFTIAVGTTIDVLLAQQSAGTEMVSLREAIYAASQSAVAQSADTSDDHRIILSAGTYQIVANALNDGRLGDLNIDGDLQIIGQGAGSTEIRMVSGNDRHFNIATGNTSLDGLLITGGTSMTNGGAILANAGTALFISDSNFTNNRSQFNGGAIYSEGSVNVTGSSISGNSALNSGAGVYAESITITNSAINNNTADMGDGGAIYATGEVKISASELRGNRATEGFGGAVSVLGDITLSDFNMTSNTARGSGGALAVSGVFEITRGQFDGNSTTQQAGGAIHASGANVVAGQTSSISSLTFTNNSALGEGGAIASQTPFTIALARFSGNSASEGAAVHAQEKLTISATHFENNSAQRSGGAIHSSSTLDVIKSSFIKNEAPVVGGGAIYHSSTDSLSVANSTFGENAARQGGAIFASNNGDISRSSFVANTTSNGGAAIFSAGAAGNVSVNNSLFAGNLNGGAGNATIAGIKNGSTNNSLDNTVSSTGYNIADFALPDNASGDIDNTDSLIGALVPASSAADNAVLVYQLLAGSAAINAAGPGLSGTTDSGGNPVDQQPDIGAFEFQGENSVVFWTDGNTIYRTNSDFATLQEITTGRNTATSIATDALRGQVFWLEEGGSRIVSLTPANSSTVTVWANVIDATSIAIDTAAAHLYIAFSGSNARIDRYDIVTGQLIDTVVSTGLNAAIDVEIHAATDRLYWAETGGNGVTAGIHGVDLSGANQTLVQAVAQSAGIALNGDGSMLYWSDQTTDQLVRYDIQANVQTPFAESSKRDPGAVAYDRVSNNVIWVSDQDGQLISQSADLSTINSTQAGGSSTIEIASFITSNAAAPALQTNNSLRVDEGDLSTPLDSSNLESTSSSVTDAQTIYSVQYGLDAGHLVVNGTANVTRFSQQDINDGLVAYQSTDDVAISDSIGLSVSDGTNESAVFEFQVEINPINDPPGLNVRADVIDVAEGGVYVLLASDLVASDVDHDQTELRYQLSEEPAQGALFLNGTAMDENDSFTQAQLTNGNVEYRPGDDEFSGLVSLEFVVSDQIDNSAEGTLRFNVTPVNDSPTLSIAIRDVAENTPGAAAGVLTVTDEEPSSITYAINDPRFEVVNQTLQLTADAIVDFEVEPSISLTLVGTDRQGAEDSLNIVLTVLDNNDAPAATENFPTTLTQGNYQLPDNSFVDQDNDVLSYSATLQNGQPLPNWLQFVPDTREFVVLDPDRTVEQLQVRIIADDGAGGRGSAVAQLTFDIVLGAANPTIETISEVPEVPDSLTSTDTTESSTVNTNQNQVESSTGLPANNSQSVNAPEYFEEEIPIESVKNLQELIQPVERFGGLELAEVQQAVSSSSSKKSDAFSQSDFNSLNLADLLSLQQRSVIAGLEQLAFAINVQQDEWNERTVSWQTLVGNSAGITSGLSVGYLVWLIRGGTLMGSVLSSLPAWRFVDPLPVLSSLSEFHEDTEDEESLESIVQQTSADADGASSDKLAGKNHANAGLADLSSDTKALARKR